MAKIYTAQEMREAADNMGASIRDIRDGNDYLWPKDSDRPEDWAAMLRQAADALEREEKREKKYEEEVK